MTSEFRKNWDNLHGFTMEEALEKKAKVDEAHQTRDFDSRWNPAEIVIDHSKVDGYMIVIKTKN